MRRYVPLNGQNFKSKKTESISVAESPLNAHREPDFKFLMTTNLPHPAVIIGLAGSADMLWLSELGGGSPKRDYPNLLQAGVLDQGLNVLICSG